MCCVGLINYGLNIPKLPIQHSVFGPPVHMEYHSHTVYIDSQEKASNPLSCATNPLESCTSLNVLGSEWLLCSAEMEDLMEA